MIYEMFKRTRAGDKPVMEFEAANDQAAFEEGTRRFMKLPAQDLGVPYLVREKASGRIVDTQ